MTDGMDQIEEADLRAIVRLLGEASALTNDLFEKRRYVLDGLCDFAGASEWRWALFSTASGDSENSGSPGDLQPQAQCLAALRRRFNRAFPSSPANMEGRELQAISPENLPAVSGSGCVIVAERRIDARTQSRIALCREGGRPYTWRETRLAMLALNEIPWLHWRAWPKRHDPAAPKLPPRQQWVLELLLKGCGRKEIADEIGIAHGTVNGYIRELYRQFEVSSQAELMRTHLGGLKRSLLKSVWVQFLAACCATIASDMLDIVLLMAA